MRSGWVEPLWRSDRRKRSPKGATPTGVANPALLLALRCCVGGYAAMLAPRRCVGGYAAMLALRCCVGGYAAMLAPRRCVGGYAAMLAPRCCVGGYAASTTSLASAMPGAVAPLFSAQSSLSSELERTSR
ncbi:MAG: hypothetical protein MSC45_05230 [Mobiluncus sp.]|uniref:hypothetical protein n=1 Tax=Mobiluncus sp. TaxID=47293 RepID=UPI0025868DC6|nr:hypothetical protein [Mobiluncus sp.]MCI6584455.1 hypothetical protein [Mobiluncus sp.]